MASVFLTIADKTSKIQSKVKSCIHSYEKGLSHIDRSGSQWTVSREGIESLHRCFSLAYDFLYEVNEYTDSLKDLLHQNVETAVSEEEVISRKIKELILRKEEIIATLPYKRKAIKEQHDNMEALNEQRRELEEELEKKKAQKARAQKNGIRSALFFVIGGLPALVVSAYHLHTIRNMEGQIQSLRSEIAHTEVLHDEASREYHAMVEEVDELEDEICSLEERVREHRNTKNKLKDKNSFTGGFSKLVKHFLNTLGLVINKIERIRDDTDPEYFYDVTILKTHIEEIEQLSPEKLLDFKLVGRLFDNLVPSGLDILGNVLSCI